jgi:hypothetical protein
MTRRHDDLHLALWSRDGERVRELLTAADWRHTRQEGYSVYELDDVRLKVAFLDHGEWPPNSFEHDVAEVAGVRARFVSLSSLGPPKGKAATIELTPAARAALLELRLDAAEGFVFTNKLGGQRQLRDVQRAFEKARDRAALPISDEGRVCFHSLRHTSISRLNHPAIPLVHVRDSPATPTS